MWMVLLSEERQVSWTKTLDNFESDEQNFEYNL